MSDESAGKNPPHRPRKFDRDKILQEFAEYIESTQLPIVAEFSYQHGFGKGLMYDWAGEENEPLAERFSDLLKLCVTKKETALETQGLHGNVNVAMAIFSLKQLGWSDKQETTHKGDSANPIVISETASRW